MDWELLKTIIGVVMGIAGIAIAGWTGLKGWLKINAAVKTWTENATKALSASNTNSDQIQELKAYIGNLRNYVVNLEGDVKTLTLQNADQAVLIGRQDAEIVKTNARFSEMEAKYEASQKLVVLYQNGINQINRDVSQLKQDSGVNHELLTRVEVSLAGLLDSATQEQERKKTTGPLGKREGNR